MIKKDIFGRELKEGDIVARAKYSEFTFHKIIGFTAVSVILSTDKRESTYSTRWYNNRYNDESIMHTTLYRVDTKTIEGVEDHAYKFYCRVWGDSPALVLY